MTNPFTSADLSVRYELVDRTGRLLTTRDDAVAAQAYCRAAIARGDWAMIRTVWR